jgi:radical SAM superfamily enzyme YgiQ (UPF0313 family)
VVKVALITPTPPDISAFGVRALSAVLKRAGHQVISIFLPGGIELLSHRREVVYGYEPRVLAAIDELTADADVVGISFMSQYFDRAEAITAHLRRRDRAMVLWGGIHASVRPEEALEHAHGVCVGEGEQPLLELCDSLAAGRDPWDAPSFLFRRNGRVIRNDPAPPLWDLDSLPPFDFELEGHFLLDPQVGELRPVTSEILARALPLMPYRGRQAITVYRTMTSRGCPHRCTYCANRWQSDGLADAGGHLRWRSTEHVMAELEAVLARYPFIRGIHFFDDVFGAMPWEKLEEFCGAYRERIGLPFYCQVSPLVISPRRLELLADSGMVFIEMGIQTGSPRIRKLYDRHETNAEILEATRLIHRQGKRLLTPRYHVILDNPWETIEDQQATIELLSRIPLPYQLCLASLVLYPGTELNRRAREEGLLQDERRQIYRRPFYRPRPTFANLLVTLMDVRWVPRPLLRMLNRKSLIRLGDTRLTRPLAAAGMAARARGALLWKGLVSLATGDFGRILRYFRRVR